MVNASALAEFSIQICASEGQQYKKTNTKKAQFSTGEFWTLAGIEERLCVCHNSMELLEKTQHLASRESLLVEKDL